MCVKHDSSTRKLRVAIIGAGLMHVWIGDYDQRDIEFSVTFDIDVNKIVKDLRGDLRSA